MLYQSDEQLEAVFVKSFWASDPLACPRVWRPPLSACGGSGAQRPHAVTVWACGHGLISNPAHVAMFTTDCSTPNVECTCPALFA